MEEIRVTPEQIERAEILSQNDDLIRMIVDMLFMAEDRGLPS